MAMRDVLNVLGDSDEPPIVVWYGDEYAVFPYVRSRRLVEAEERYAELLEACRDAEEAMAVLQDKDDGGLISPARHRLRQLIEKAEGREG